MGMFDGASSAITSAEGVMDHANDPLKDASSLLGGGPAYNGDAGSDQDVTWVHGRDLDELDKQDAASNAANIQNVLDAGDVIEFIHFGFVHLSESHYFPHNKYSDTTKNKDVEADAKPRAIQFRSGVEREAILLSEFIRSTKSVLEERDAGAGGLGAALNTVGNLLGASGGGKGRTSADDLEAHLQKVKAAVQPALVSPIKYQNTHKAGRDLHQERANYRNLLVKISKEKPPESGPGGLIAKLPGIGGSVAGPMADVVSFAQGIAFKAPEIKAKFFVLMAIQQEAQVELACNAVTLKGIDETHNPFFPVWFRVPEDADPDDPTRPDRPDGWYDKARYDANYAMVDAANKVNKAEKKLKGFFEVPPPASGAEELAIAFTSPPAPKPDKKVVPMGAGAVAYQAFFDTLDMKKPPQGFIKSLISGIVAVALEFTEGVYKALLTRDEMQPITKDALLESAREGMGIAQRLENLALDSLGFLKTMHDWQTPNFGGVALPGLGGAGDGWQDPSIKGFQTRPGGVMDKGAGFLDDLIADKVRPVLDPILNYAMGSLADQLEAARQAGTGSKSHTMEWYLGRLPMIQATLFCNLFFPLWDTIMNAAISLLDSATGGILSKISGVAASLRNDVKAIQSAATAAKQAAEDAKAKMAATDRAVDQAGTDLSQGANISDLSSAEAFGQTVSRDAGGISNATGAKGDRVQGPGGDGTQKTVLPDNPVQGRTLDGEAQAIPDDEYTEVSNEHKWHRGDPPLDTGNTTDDASGGSSGGGGGNATPAPATNNA